MGDIAKAKELVGSFYYALPNNGSLKEGINSCQARYKEAIICATICVNKIIEEIEFSSQADELSKTSYWQEVKNEIQNLNNG